MNDIFMLSNFHDLSNGVNEPLKQTQRIKYTCFDASENFITFGASSGSLYLFNRKPCKFLYLIPNKHGSVNVLSISPNEKFIAFATVKGVICVYVINLSPNSSPQIITSNIGESPVTYLHWSADEKQFYYGNKSGEVHLVTLSFFMGRNLLNISVHPILFLESPIVQISDFESLLLVSNYTKCILCNTEYEEFKQIGNRPRDGYYGACFSILPNENFQGSRIYCARPGSRVWEVDLEGNVLQTHQFKTALTCPPTKITKSTDAIAPKDDDDNIADYQPQNLQFTKLQIIFEDYILTSTDTGIYVFDPKSSSVVLWCNELKPILDCKVIGDEIIVFTSSGSLYTLRLQTMQSYAIDLVSKQSLIECVNFLKTNLKYFAEKAKEEYELRILNVIKTYLIDTNQYEILNDLSVIFDSINQTEDITIKSKQLDTGIYMLENSFCDNLKLKSNPDKQFKDALLTVTGKFGKNVIKYKFNIFSEDQKSFVNDLIPNERQIPFKEINEQFENDEDIVCNRSLCKKAQNANVFSEQIFSDEQKTIHNLFMIFKSSKISNINFVDRYSLVFDKYDSRELMKLLEQLEQVMIENGDSKIEAKKNCYEMYFNYLKPEIIWELDDISREFIIKGFILINDIDVDRCDGCNFPISFESLCQFHDIGEVLIKFLWSRNEQQRCIDIVKSVPSLIDVICRFYLQENQMHKVIPIALYCGDIKLFEDAAKQFDMEMWNKSFQIFTLTLEGTFNCINCDTIVKHEVKNHFFYTWTCFLDVALQNMSATEILNLIVKYSSYIPNNAIDREFFIKSLLK